MKIKSLLRSMNHCVAGLSVMAASAGAAAVELDVAGTKVNLYGYLKLDMIYDKDADLGPLLIPSKIALDNDQSPEGFYRTSAEESRLGVSTLTTLEDGSELKTVLEGDFFSGSGTLRLRHAYGEWKGILAGQTWTNFPGFTGIYPTIDFRAPISSSNTRQAQLRYTTGNFSAALEDPDKLGGEVVETATTVAAAAKSSLPDLTLRYSSRGQTSYHAAAVMRQLEVDDGVDSDSAFGWGVSLGIARHVTDTLTLRASVVHGDGVGGYLNLNPAAPAYVNASGDVETISATGGTVSATLKAGPGAVTLGMAMATADWDDAVDDGLTNAESANKEFRSTHLNYIWSPVKKVTFGIEAGYHERKIWSGDSGDALRIQGMAKFAF